MLEDLPERLNKALDEYNQGFIDGFSLARRSVREAQLTYDQVIEELQYEIASLRNELHFLRG